MKNRKSQSGVAIIEFALILPMLLVMTFITTEFGRALYQYNTVAKSVRDAARYLATQSPAALLTPEDAATQRQNVANLIVYGNSAGTGAPLAFGLTTSHVAAPVWNLEGAVPVINTVTVRVTGYSFRSIFSTAFGQSFGTIPYSDITATMRSHT